MGEGITVLVADEHAVVRAGIGVILGAEPDVSIVGEATDGVEAVRKAVELKPDLILMDIFMARRSGLEALIEIKEKLPGTRVLIFTISERDEDLLQALRFGAQGYVLKSATISELLDAVRKIAAGEVMLSPRMVTRLVAELRERADEPRLSVREAEVLRLLGEGLTNTEIANRLFVSESTVRTYLHRLMDKLHLRNRVQAAIYAGRHHVTHKSLWV